MDLDAWSWSFSNGICVCYLSHNSVCHWLHYFCSRPSMMWNTVPDPEDVGGGLLWYAWDFQQYKRAPDQRQRRNNHPGLCMCIGMYTWFVLCYTYHQLKLSWECLEQTYLPAAPLFRHADKVPDMSANNADNIPDMAIMSGSWHGHNVWVLQTAYIVCKCLLSLL